MIEETKHAQSEYVREAYKRTNYGIKIYSN